MGCSSSILTVPRRLRGGAGLAIRRRIDGGYTVSESVVVAEIVPDSFRLFREFLTLLRMERKGIKFRQCQIIRLQRCCWKEI
jgi:hypothetical protein